MIRKTARIYDLGINTVEYAKDIHDNRARATENDRRWITQMGCAFYGNLNTKIPALYY